MTPKKLYYYCERCNTDWTDTYSEEYGECSDDCGVCGNRHINPMTNATKFKAYLKVQRKKFEKNRNNEEYEALDDYLFAETTSIVNDVLEAYYEPLNDKDYDQALKRLETKLKKIIKVGLRSIK